MKHVLSAIAVLCLIVGSAFAETGTASYYGPGFHGRTTASGARFDQNAATCAHRRYRFGTRLRVTNLKNGRVANCTVNDRGPYAGGRVLDVSKGIASRLDMIRAGTARVRIDRLN